MNIKLDVFKTLKNVDADGTSMNVSSYVNASIKKLTLV